MWEVEKRNLQKVIDDQHHELVEKEEEVAMLNEQVT